MSVFNEDTRVKIPATIQFLRIGYDYQSLREADIDFNTQKEIDDMSDSSQKEVTPDEFRKKKSPVLLETKQNSQDSENVEEEVAQQEAEDFYLLVSIYGSILKNAELLDNRLTGGLWQWLCVYPAR